MSKPVVCNGILWRGVAQSPGLSQRTPQVSIPPARAMPRLTLRRAATYC